MEIKKIKTKREMKLVANMVEGLILEALSIFTDRTSVERTESDDRTKFVVYNSNTDILTSSEVERVQEALADYFKVYHLSVWYSFGTMPYWVDSIGVFMYRPTLEIEVKIR